MKLSSNPHDSRPAPPGLRRSILAKSIAFLVVPLLSVAGSVFLSSAAHGAVSAALSTGTLTDTLGAGGDTSTLSTSTSGSTIQVTGTGLVTTTFGGVTAINANFAASNQILTLDATNVSFTPALTVTATGGASNDSVVKIGSLTATLTGANSYTGVTTINSGTLQLALSPASPVSVSLAGAVNLAGSTAKLVLPAGATQGLNGEYFNTAPVQPDPNNFTTLPGLQSYLSTLTPSLVANSTLAGPNFDFGNNGLNFPAPYNSGSADDFEALWMGQFDAQTAGAYTFATTSDDGSVLFIDGTMVVNNNFMQGATQRTGTIDLTAGEHDIVVAYYQGGGGYTLSADFAPPGGGGLQPLLNSLLLSSPLVSIGTLTGVAGSQIVLNDSALTVNQATDGVFAGTIVDGSGGGGSLTKTGVGTLILTGANTYTGGTTITTGTLQLGNGGTSGSIVGNVVDNAALVFDRSDNTTFAGNVSGMGSMTKLGTNTLTITGDFTHTGGTTVFGTLQIGNGGTSGSIAGNITDNGTILFNRSDDNTFSGNISGPGSVIKNGANTLTFSGTNTYTGPTTINAGVLQLQAASGTSQSLAGPVILAHAAATLSLGTQPGLNGLYFNTSNLPDSNNFVSLAALQNHLSTLTPALEANSSLAGANFDFSLDQNFPAPYNSGFASDFEAEWTGKFDAQTAGSYNFFTTSDDGSVLFIDGTMVVNNNFSQGATQRGGTITLSAGEHDIVIAYYQGGGGYSLNASYTPPGGSMALLPNSLLASSTTATIGSLSGVAGSQVVLNGDQLTVNQTTDAVFAGVISDGLFTGGQLIKDGPAVLALTGTNTYTGGTTITAGTLQLGNGGTSGSILGDVVDNGVLAFDRSDNNTFTGNVSGSGSVTKFGTNTLTITGDFAHAGGTTVYGTLQIGNGGTSGSVAGNITDNGTILFNRSDDNTFSGNISGPGSVIKNGANTLIFSGANTYIGATIINAGVLQVQAPSGSESFAGPVILAHAAATLSLGSQPGLNGEYFNTSLNGPDSNNFVSLAALQSHFSTMTPALVANSTLAGANFDFGNNGQNFPAPYNSNASNFEAEWTGKFDAQTTGLYSFFTTSDDGSVLFIDGTMVVNNNAFQGATQRGGTIDLSAGEHDIVIAYYQGGGGYALSADYTAPGGSEIPLLNSLLSANGATNTSIGSLSGVAGSQIQLDGAQLTVNQTTNGIFAGVISEGGLFTGGQLIKNGPAALTLSAANTYTGGTTINAGLLLAANTSGSATGPGTVTVNSGAALGGRGTVGPVTLNGTLVPGAGTPGIVGSTLHTGPVTWNGRGALTLQLGGGTADMLAVTGTLSKGSVGTYTLNLVNAGVTPTDYTLATFTNTTFALGDFTLVLPTGISGTLQENATSLSFDVTAANMGGSVIENDGPVFTPTFASFTVSGSTMTGSPTESNEIRELIFSQGGWLKIFETLFVAQGPVNLVNGSAITLENGNLSVNQLNVLYGGLLNGNGWIFGNLINLGTVSPGDAPGIIHVSGNYTQGPSGLLQIQIGGGGIGEYSLLGVNGAAALGGTLQLIRLNNYKLRLNEPITFLTATGGIVGRFSSVEDGFGTDNILVPTVVYHPNSVALEAKQGSFVQLADREQLPPNERNIAGSLDRAAGDPRAATLFNFLDYQSLDRLPKDLERISPEELTSIFTASVAYAQQQSINLQQRTEDIRNGIGGFSSQRFAMTGDTPSYSGDFNISTGVSGPSGDDGKDMKMTTEVAPAESRWGAFVSGTGDWVNVSGTENARGYDLASGGFTLGIDYKFTENFAVGLAMGYTGTTADLSNHGRVWVNGGKLGVYSTVFEGGWYADMAAFGGYNGYDTRRSALEGDARGTTHGGEVDALFGTGYDFKKGNLTFGPTASFNYTYTGVNGFTEHDSLAPLDIHGGSADSLRTAFGLKVSYDWKVGGVIIKPELSAAWQHEFGDTTYLLDSSFANGTGGAFGVSGPRFGRDSALIGAGFAIQLNDRCSTYLYYDGNIGRTNYESEGVTGGLRVVF